MKKLIALAIAALPAAAMADVTIYGEIGGAFESNSTQGIQIVNGKAVQGQRQTVNRVESYNSKIGFKGNEDLGNGLKAIWQVESELNIDNSSSQNSFATRDSFVGLTSNSFGTIQAGRLSSFINLESKLDPWKYSDGFNGLASNNGIARYETRFNNAIAYTSPEFAGFSARALYSAAGEVRTARGENTNAYDLGLKYTNSGFYGLYSYTASNNAGPLGAVSNTAGQPVYDAQGNPIPGANVNLTDNSKTKAHHVQVGYDANNLLVAVEYLQTKTNATNGSTLAFADVDNLGRPIVVVSGVNEVKTQEAGLNVAYTIGAFQPRFQYVHGWKVKADSNNVDGSDYNQYILGANYYLSKRTHAHISAGWKKSGTDNAGLRETDGRTFAVGLNHLF